MTAAPQSFQQTSPVVRHTPTLEDVILEALELRQHLLSAEKDYSASVVVDCISTIGDLKARIQELETALNTSRVALMTIRGCSIVGAERGYGQPELWSDNLFRSHGDVATALKVIDAALSKGAA